jgi:cephalosporin-C deacetylase
VPVVDLSVDELVDYTGRNPKPDDFDAYWSDALAELDATPAEVELLPATFICRAAEAYDLWFSGVRGARVHAKVLIPRGVANAPGLVAFHGYSQNSGDWSQRLAYASEGFVVVSMDVRGQGGQSTDPGGHKGTTFYGHIVRGATDAPENLLYRHIYLDCVRLVQTVASLPQVDATRICAIGASQGGGLALACAALEPSIVRVASQFPFLCDWKRVWELNLMNGAYDALRWHFRMFDPLHREEEEFFTTMGYIDVQHLAPRIEADVLMAVALLDEICPPSTQFAAYNKIRSSKTVEIFPDFGHEDLPMWADLSFEFFRAVRDAAS